MRHVAYVLGVYLTCFSNVSAQNWPEEDPLEKQEKIRMLHRIMDGAPDPSNVLTFLDAIDSLPEVVAENTREFLRVSLAAEMMYSLTPPDPAIARLIRSGDPRLQRIAVLALDSAVLRSGTAWFADADLRRCFVTLVFSKRTPADLRDRGVWILANAGLVRKSRELAVALTKGASCEFSETVARSFAQPLANRGPEEVAAAAVTERGVLGDVALIVLLERYSLEELDSRTLATLTDRAAAVLLDGGVCPALRLQLAGEAMDQIRIPIVRATFLRLLDPAEWFEGYLGETHHHILPIITEALAGLHEPFVDKEIEATAEYWSRLDPDTVRELQEILSKRD
jgi:hypothetical protein